MKFGMFGCVVRDHTVKAVIDMPGVLATFLNGGAQGLGDDRAAIEHIVAFRADIARIRQPPARIAHLLPFGHRGHHGEARGNERENPRSSHSWHPLLLIDLLAA